MYNHTGKIKHLTTYPMHFFLHYSIPVCWWWHLFFLLLEGWLWHLLLRRRSIGKVIFCNLTWLLLLLCNVYFNGSLFCEWRGMDLLLYFFYCLLKPGLGFWVQWHPIWPFNPEMCWAKSSWWRRRCITFLSVIFRLMSSLCLCISHEFAYGVSIFFLKIR